MSISQASSEGIISIDNESDGIAGKSKSILSYL